MVLIDHQILDYFIKKSNAAKIIARSIILLQEFDLEIVHRAGTKHENVDFFLQMEKKVEVVSEDDEFFLVQILMMMDIENKFKNYAFSRWYNQIDKNDNCI